MIRALAVTLLLAGTALLTACPSTPRPGLPNLVVISLDTTRADHLGLYGYFRDTSPHLDALAEQSLVFERALAPMATTLPTHASLFTASYPAEHGVLANLGHGGSRLETSDSLQTLAMVARDAGYVTGAFVSSAPLKRGSGIEAGFDTFVEPAGGEVLRTGDLTTNDALAWLGKRADSPYLLWVHYFDAHWPYTNPGPGAPAFHTDSALDEWIAERAISATSLREGVGQEASRAAHNAYDRALHFQDAQLGRLLDALAARPDWHDTTVVIVGDHGEGLSQHGHAAHGETWEEQLRVPMVVRIPGEGARRIASLTSLVDLLPTLVARLDAPEFAAVAAQGGGHDALVSGAGERAIFAQDTGRVKQRPGYRTSLTTKRWKYFRTDDADEANHERLFDLVNDPFELTDVAAAHPEILRRLGAALDREAEAQRLRGEALRGGAKPAARKPSPELIEQLRQLGYIDTDTTAQTRPNVLFVVWDTVRADRLSLYGHARETTPQLAKWARGARVFENATSSASSTVPSHASLFTGLLPSEHGTHAAHQWLDDRFDTLAEKLQAAGYRTFLWAANPHIGASKNFAQGFDREEHPWDPEWRDAARKILEAKLPEGEWGRNLGQRIGRADATWPLASAGALASDALEGFLDDLDGNAPWFAFLNYMEAHRPYLPAAEHRRAFMDAAQFERSYRLSVAWPTVWAHVFGLQRYAAEDLDILGATYDAALRELDSLFADLLARLDARGALENTVVVLTADHGELLGEHGLLDHQYSLYQPLIGVPLVLWAPGRVAAGRSDVPVMALDLYPTLLEMTGVATGDAPSLLDPQSDRVRLAEYPAIFSKPFQSVAARAKPGNLDRFRRRLRALLSGPYKLIEGEDGNDELYDLRADPEEHSNLADSDTQTRARLREQLFTLVRELDMPAPAGHEPESLSVQEARLLTELGYAEDSRDAAETPPKFEAHSSWTPNPAAPPND
jgi:arylsulfatase A-like enzyme